MILPSIIHLSFIWKTCYTHYPPHCNLFYSRYSKHSNIIICACAVNVLCQTFFEHLEEVWIPDLQPESQSKERNKLLQDLKCFKPSVCGYNIKSEFQGCSVFKVLQLHVFMFNPRLSETHRARLLLNASRLRRSRFRWWCKLICKSKGCSTKLQFATYFKQIPLQC